MRLGSVHAGVQSQFIMVEYNFIGGRTEGGGDISILPSKILFLHLCTICTNYLNKLVSLVICLLAIITATTINFTSLFPAIKLVDIVSMYYIALGMLISSCIGPFIQNAVIFQRLAILKF